MLRCLGPALLTAGSFGLTLPSAVCRNFGSYLKSTRLAVSGVGWIPSVSVCGCEWCICVVVYLCVAVSNGGGHLI